MRRPVFFLSVLCSFNSTFNPLSCLLLKRTPIQLCYFGPTAEIKGNFGLFFKPLKYVPERLGFYYKSHKPLISPSFLVFERQQAVTLVLSVADVRHLHEA